MKKYFLLILLTCLCTPVLHAQGPLADADSLKRKLPPIQKFYVGSALDGAIFSTATIQSSATSASGVKTTLNATGTIRFSLVINTGLTFNFNLSRHLGIYTGIDLKNVGYIYKDPSGNTVKRRTYNLGAPLGIKVGNMARKRGYFFLGGGMDVPVQYKEKTFVIRSEKSKINEFFSDRTPLLMPYVFAGITLGNGGTLKVQYYPNNYLNPDFVTKGTMPYAGMDVHLILLSLGINIRYGKHPDMVTKQVEQLKTM